MQPSRALLGATFDTVATTSARIYVVRLRPGPSGIHTRMLARFLNTRLRPLIWADPSVDYGMSNLCAGNVAWMGRIRW